MDELVEPLKGWVKGFNPSTLTEAISKTRSMASSSASSSSSRIHSHPKPPTFPRDKPRPKKPLLDEASRQELRRKKLCFNYKGPWEPSHRCLGKGKIHYIEVMSDEEDEQEREETPVEDIQPSGDTDMANFNCTERITALIKCGGSTALAGNPRCTVFRVRGTLQGQRVTVILDSGATLNFINSSLVQ